MNIKIKKSLGQNFLIDKNIINKIINIGNIEEKDAVLEIGPGTGKLTEYILKKKPNKFFVIEKDSNLTKILKKKFDNQIKIINQDILDFKLENIKENNLIIFGNLPYNISSQILIKLITYTKKNSTFKKFILMFQKEVADKILAKINSKNYGRLSIISNWKLDIKKELNISADCFFPRPKIDSTLLSFEPKKEYFVINNTKSLEYITRVFFNQRRKMIKKPLKQIFDNPKEIAENFAIDINLRPQNLSPLIYFKLAREYEKIK